MDIFTTVLTRVVPVPIKSADLKVKAVLKDAAVGELKEDLNHVENHDYYFNNDKKKQKESEQNKQNKSANGEQTEAATIEPETSTLKSKDKNHEEHADEGLTESKDGTKHLDLYV